MGRQNATHGEASMGTTLSSEQTENLRTGRAMYNDSYVEYPEGCAAKAIWGTPRTGQDGWKEGHKFWNKEEAIDVSTLAVEQLMERRGSSSLYNEFMRAVYAAMEGTCFWRRRVLTERKRFAPQFAGMAVATRSTVEKFRWWYALWGQSTDKALPPIGCGCTGPEAVTLLSADFSKEV